MIHRLGRISIIIGILASFSCKHEKEKLDINLEKIDLDYHFISYQDFSISKEKYLPENIGFTFSIANKTSTRIEKPLYSKFDEDISNIIYLKKGIDSIKLSSLSNKILLNPGEKRNLSAELMTHNYENLENLLRQIPDSNYLDSIKEFELVIKFNSKFFVSNDKFDKVQLTFSDTTFYK